MKPTNQAQYRIYTVMAITCAAGLIVIGQLVRWQVIEHYRFVALAEAERDGSLTTPARRGEIREQGGQLLAADIIQYDISASPQVISDPAAVAGRLSPLLEIPQAELSQILTGEAAWIPIQYLIERELETAVTRYRARGGSVVVLNPKTGAVLGMASYPTYNPNDYSASDEKLFFDPNVSEQYEMAHSQAGQMVLATMPGCQYC